MKIVAILAIYVLIEGVYCKNAWETEASRIDLQERQAQASKRSIIVYDKSQMSLEDVEAEAERIEAKCAIV